VLLLAAALLLLAGACQCPAAGGTVGASAKEQKARRAKLSSELASLRLDAARQAVQEAEVRLKAAQEGLQLAQGRYEAGVGSQEDVSSHQVALAAASTALAKAQADLAEVQASAASRVTLSVVGAAVKAALSKLFEGTGQSYVLDPTVVEGIPITVTLNNVEFGKALAAVCEAAGLHCENRDGVWAISKATDMATIGGFRWPVVGAMGVSRPTLPGEMPGNIQFGDSRILRQLAGGGEPLEFELPGAPKHPSFKGEDSLIDLDVKDMPLSEVAAKLSQRVPPPKPRELRRGFPMEEFRSVEIVVDDSIKNLKVTARIHKWPLGKVLDLLIGQAGLACSREDVRGEPIPALPDTVLDSEGREVPVEDPNNSVYAPTTKLYLVPRPELSVSVRGGTGGGGMSLGPK
jgi:hypothetical protein